MTTIDRLGILGIRSYGTEEETFIKFFKPLTIILGRNGSGKSTIIEAVKMAATGDLPPMVDNGAAFIHDPRIDNETETRAKIRLMFSNVRGEQFIVTRHFLLTVRTALRGAGLKTEFKSLDHTLKRPNGSTSSFRMNDLNSLLPDVMRVTKPVLNNVIFVHQEDSLWPLGDSKKLKEKFDEIFAATRYTKALETIRKYRRDQAADLKAVKMEIKLYESKVEVLQKLRAEVDTAKIDYDGLRKGEDELNLSLSRLNEQLNAAKKVSEAYQQKQDELTKLNIKAGEINKGKEEKYRALQVHLRDMSETAINEEITRCRRELDGALRDRAQRARNIDRLVEKVDMKRKIFNVKQGKQGMLEQQAKLHQERLQTIESMKKEVVDKQMFTKTFTDVAADLIAPNFNDDLSSWTNAFETLRSDAEANVQKVSRECNESLDKANAQLSSVKMKVETTRSEQNRRREEVARMRTDIAAIRNELRSLDGSQTLTVDAEKKRVAADKVFREKRAKNTVRTLEESIAKEKRQVANLRDDLLASRQTREQLQQDQNEQTRLQISRETSNTKRKNLNCLFEDFVDQLISCSDLLTSKGADTSDFVAMKRELRQMMDSDDDDNVDDRRQTLMDVSSRVLAKRDSILQNSEQVVNELKAKLSAISVRKREMQREAEKSKRELKSTDEEFSSMKLKLSDCHGEISEVTDTEHESSGSDFKVDHLVQMFENVSISSDDKSLTLRKEHVEAVSKSVGEANAAVLTATQYVSALESGRYIAESDFKRFNDSSRNRCPACGTCTSNAQKAKEMKEHLAKRIDKLGNPKHKESAELKKSKFEGAAVMVQKLHTHCSNAMNAIEKYESSTERLRALEREETQLKRGCATEKEKLDDLQNSIGAGSSLEHIVGRRVEVRQASVDYERAKNVTTQLETTVSASSGETMTLSEAEEKVRKLEESIQNMQDKIERDGRTLDREREDLRKAENRVHAAKEQVLELKANSEKYKRLSHEKDDLTKNIMTAEQAIVNAQAKLDSFKGEEEFAEAEFATVRAENEYRVKEANGEMSNRKVFVIGWKDCMSEVEAYLRSGKQRELESNTRNLETIETEIKEDSNSLEKLRKEEQAASDTQMATESRIRNLNDNKMYMLQEEQSKVNMRSVQLVEQSMEEIVKEAGEDPHEKVTRITKDVNQTNSNLYATRAKRHVYRNQYESKKKEHQEAEREGSRQKFDSCRIKKQTMELASSDLERYHRALDQALMAFHTLKMGSINRTIKELWQRTYQGTDIDEIEITSDHNRDARGEGSGLVKRNFNYRVLMRRGQAQLDMRGRCSAGQKVLACLVIRLALAESFCTDCGILALDEPTTNLDQANITSLAHALRAIIETRKEQRNFQLVLITHDEEFIETIGARDFCSDYFKIFKNERQKSCAEIKSLQEVGG